MAVGIPPNPSRACLRTRPAAQFTPVDRASDRPSQQRLLAQEVSLTAQRDGMLRELDQTRARVESMAQGLTLIEADDPASEAGAIAVLIRDSVHHGRPVTLIAADRTLTADEASALREAATAVAHERFGAEVRS